MTWLKSFKKFMKTPGCGCTKKTRKNKHSKHSKHSRGKKHRGGYQTIGNKTISSPKSRKSRKSL